MQISTVSRLNACFDAVVAAASVCSHRWVYAQLVAVHVRERGAGTAALDEKTADLDGKISTQTHNVADLDRRVSQIDSAIEEAARRGKTNAALSAMEGQRRTRAALEDERKREWRSSAQKVDTGVNSFQR
jgi:hypothetical protein